MSGDKVSSPCSHFQANIFNKSKCQNCFKSRELHPPSDHDLEQVKPIYAGWLCLAPEGTDFDNPVHRSRKWQRRFFILYEDGSLSFALDELPSTLPQGSVNMNKCTHIMDAEPRTGQRNAVWIATSEQEIFIRGDNKDIINGWSEQLSVCLQANKQNATKKKRKVDPLDAQESSKNAKMAATAVRRQSSSGDSSERKDWEREEGPQHTITDGTDAPSIELTCTDDVPPHRCVTPRDPVSPDVSIHKPAYRERRASDRSRGSSAERLQGSEVIAGEQEVELPCGRQGRSEARTNTREKLSSCGDVSQLQPPAAPQRRAKSLDRRTSDSVITPDLLNFKKGWMVKLDGNDQWKKFWFVLSTDSLRYYRDSMAEEASDLEGEIDLTTCFSVSEYQVQRNYGFQIHTSTGVFTLSAMTAGIRRNWIQALMKNVLPANAPDVASLPAHHISCSPPEVLPKPDVTQDSPPTIDPGGRDLQPRPRSASERRRGEVHRISDWAELRPCSEPSSPARSPCSLELMDIERRKRREERRKRYESILGFSLGWEEVGGQTGDVRTISPKSKRKMEAELEECWRKVEQVMFRPERMILLLTKSRDVLEMETLLQSYRQAMEELTGKLAESESCRLKLEAPRNAEELRQRQADSPLGSDIFLSDVKTLPSNQQTESLSRCKDVIELEPLQPPASPRPPPSIWLHDTNGSLYELQDLLSETNPSPCLSPAAETHSRDDPSEDDGLLQHDTSDLEDLLDEEDAPLFSSTGTKLSNGDFSSLILETLPDLEQGPPPNYNPANEGVVMKLSQEVELLTSQNKALNQRNQEMLNQLTEADREIERLKAELSSRYMEPRHLPEAEQQGKAGLEDLQQELSLSKQQLLEAQTLISSLEDNLRHVEGLQLQEEPGDGADEEDAHTLHRLQATEAKVMELERRLSQSEQTRKELQSENTKLSEEENLHHQREAELEAELQKVMEELEKERLKAEERSREMTGEAMMEQVMEQVRTRLQALLRLLEIMDELDWEQERVEEDQSSTAATELKHEEKFWTLTLNKLKEKPSALRAATDELLIEATEEMILENQLLLRGHALLHESSEPSRHSTDGTSGKRRNRLKMITQIKLSLLHQVTSSACDDGAVVQLMSHRGFHLHSSLRSHFVPVVRSAATEALLGSRLEEHIRRSCASCERLTEELGELRATLTNLQRTSSNVCCQTDQTFLQDADVQTDTQATDAEETHNSDPELLTLALNVQVEELKAELSAVTEQFQVKLSNARKEKETEVEKMKAACEQGFSCMEESHLKLVEELQHRHQVEVQRLLLERDRLLEEETAATATAIEAIRNTHQQELQREVHRRSLSENSSGDALLQEVLRQHSEDLSSHQRELHVLSQQFTLKCLENGHLVQAVDAERKALCQCQQENQDLRTRNQELSGHLAAEITRLCSLAKQDAPPLSQRMDVYEMEIMLRVKESEVQCLKQEIVSLKDELQSALRDKRNATKKYKDMYTELSIVRAKAERDADELRENLQLAHLALGQTAP